MHIILKTKCKIFIKIILKLFAIEQQLFKITHYAKDWRKTTLFNMKPNTYHTNNLIMAFAVKQLMLTLMLNRQFTNVVQQQKPRTRGHSLQIYSFSK